METNLTINELVSKVLAELERLNYSYNSLCGFSAFYKRVTAFAKEKEEVYFSEELGREFLKEKWLTFNDHKWLTFIFQLWVTLFMRQQLY